MAIGDGGGETVGGDGGVNRRARELGSGGGTAVHVARPMNFKPHQSHLSFPGGAGSGRGGPFPQSFAIPSPLVHAQILEQAASSGGGRRRGPTGISHVDVTARIRHWRRDG